MKYALLILALSLMIVAGTVEANTYTGTYYSTNTTMTAGSIQAPSVVKDESCSATLNVRTYLVGSGFDTGVNYFSPDSTPIGTGSKNNKDVILCSTFGEYSTTADLSNYYESSATYTTSATSGNVTLETFYSCDETSLYYDVIGDTFTTDSFGNIVGRYSSTGGAFGSTYYTNAYASNYHNCYSSLQTNPLTTASSGGTSCTDYRRTVYAYYPFNSGTEGIVDYSFNMGNTTYDVVQCTDSCTGTQTAYANLYLVKVADESNSLLWSDSVDCGGGGTKRITGDVSGSLTLDPESEYMFTFASYNGDTGSPCPCSRSYSHREPLDYNISVYVYEPDWNCSTWSSCSDGEQWRTCSDTNGIAIDKTEFQTCSLIVLQNATLGFEEYYSDYALKCVPNWLINYHVSGYCTYDIFNMTRDTPLGWTVYEDFTSEGIQRDFLRMTDDWATEGSRSLKMWFIPPKVGEPITNTTCGNATTGYTPLVYQGVSNDTFSVTYNVTFPAEDMMLSFDVKGCHEQVVQNDALQWYFIEECPKQCYANDCNSTPDSEFQFFLRDGDGDIITNYFDKADSFRSDKIEMDLTGLGIVAGVNYTLNFQATPENLNSQEGNCVMFDNVKYEVLGQSYLDIIGGDCSVGSLCVGSTLYETHQYENGACVVVKKEDACGLSAEIIDKIANREDYCKLDASDILMRYDYNINDWREIECDYTCEDYACITEEEAEAEEIALTLYDPPEIVGDLLTEWTLTEADYGVVWFFLSMFMLVNYLALGLGIGVALLVRGNTREGGHSSSKDLWIPFTITVLIILVSTTLGGWYPLEVGAVLIVGIGLLLWKNSEKIIGGG